MTGNISAATATLFMNADMKPALTMITPMMEASLFPDRFNTSLPTQLATPVFVRPLLKINTAHTVITAGLLNPAKAFKGSTRPVIATLPMTSIATTSMGSHSVISKKAATDKRLNTIMIWGVIFSSYTYQLSFRVLFTPFLSMDPS